MTSSRRTFIKAGIAGGVASTLPITAVAGKKHKDFKPKSILILGGTGFIGPHMVGEALRRGHSVTLFNRGRTNNELFPDLETIQGDRNNGLDGLKGRKWDAVIDNSGYVPRHVQDSARLLAKNTDHYLYISTVAVYADFSIANDESSALATIADESIEEVNGETYGPLKALCEKRAASEIDADQLTIIRPTYIAGPGDHTDRFSYWPIRVRKGGAMIWPGKPGDAIQIVDVRDLANFTIDCLDHSTMGTYNAVNAPGSYTMGQLLEDSQAITATSVDPVWIGEEFAYEQDLIGGRSLPIWHPKTGEQGSPGSFSVAAARKAGLHNRPERETARDLLVWWDTLSEERRAGMKSGIAADREAELIAAWKNKA